MYLYQVRKLAPGLGTTNLLLFLLFVLLLTVSEFALLLFYNIYIFITLLHIFREFLFNPVVSIFFTSSS
jgi:hypothetical protein